VEVELRKIEGNGVELELKFKVQWRWGGVEVELKEMLVEVEENFDNLKLILM
jgi:hypothetical protein